MISFSEDTANKTGFSARTVQQKRGSGTMQQLAFQALKTECELNLMFLKFRLSSVVSQLR